MLFSCKVSSSILKSLDKQGRDLSSLLSAMDVPLEFLKDSSCWLEAQKMEFFLSEVDQVFHDLPEDFVRSVGRQSESLRSWGVLDNVLKMVESPADIYNQPNRFLSYFISPEPPVIEWKQGVGGTSFQLPVLESQYPYVTEYFCGALEGLPAYMGQVGAQVSWEESLVTIRWSQQQESLLSEEDLNLRQFNPQWVRTVMENLERHQKSVESQRLGDVIDPTSSVEVDQLRNLIGDYQKQMKDMHTDIIDIKDDFLKLHDYFARAQQLITFLVHSGRKTKQVDEAMRRMDWDHVQKSYADMVELACDRILNARDRVQGLSQHQSELPDSTPEAVVLDVESTDNLQLPIHH